MISYERDREKWGQHDKSASVVKALQTSCHSVQSGLLCSESHYHKALHTWTMSPFWNILASQKIIFNAHSVNIIGQKRHV